MAEGTLLAGRYRLESRLGQGGMADVWRARDEFLGRTVAVKEVRLPSGLDAGQRADFCERLLREARAAAALPHPSIITVHDVLQAGDRPWIVMDLINGPSLEHVRVERGPLPPERVAEIGLQLLEALCLAHERGILHRDVKPANVLLSGDRAILTDFGIATLSGDHRLTSAEGIIGSPGYMAPERLQDGHGAGPSSDLWSLGATLYALVEGRRPFEKPNALAMLGAVLTEDVPPPRLAGPVLGPVLTAMMDRHPHQRPVPAEIRRAFETVAGVTPSVMPRPPSVFPGGPPVFPGDAPTVPGTPPPPRRGGLLFAGAGGLVVVLLAVAGYLLFRPDASRQEKEPPSPPVAVPSASFTAVPDDPCTLLTSEQSEGLVGSSSGSPKDSVTCVWSASEGRLQIKARFLEPRGDKSGEELARDTFALLKRQATGSSGIGADPAVTAVDSAPRDLPGLGDEAFTKESTVSGSFAGAASFVQVRSGRLLLEIEYHLSGVSEVSATMRSTPERAARQVLENLGA
ncbi:serine/threonine-protein kinase [Actinocorallia populi]|uniref:serine/threonine-protein kinase n=1 Tax=Actinocorallia populi TaxID=2079200 RepID=UPI000D093AFA|nr:serine/threonine-protein kinase [Actinocorallia populi]